eukprot:COSAG02_NODE_3274_length_7030_cov_14.860008_4_plen_38_part_00
MEKSPVRTQRLVLQLYIHTVASAKFLHALERRAAMGQ